MSAQKTCPPKAELVARGSTTRVTIIMYHNTRADNNNNVQVVFIYVSTTIRVCRDNATGQDAIMISNAAMTAAADDGSFTRTVQVSANFRHSDFRVQCWQPVRLLIIQYDRQTLIRRTWYIISYTCTYILYNIYRL